jgi:hypothetical protein
MQGKKVLKNVDVHSIGITAMYMASKYEDVYPFSSFIAYERISHKAVAQKDILRMEGDFLRLFEFSLEVVTPFDFHQYIMGLLTSNFTIHYPDLSTYLKKVEELSLLLIRMALENHLDFMRDIPHSVLACSAIHTACSLLQ